MARRPFTSIRRLVAFGVLLPLLAALLWLTWHVSAKNREVANWPQVLAQVVEVTDDRVRLQFFWRGDLLRGDVKREHAFVKLAPYETIQLLANPANPAQLSATGLLEVWAGTIALGGLSAVVAAIAIVLLRRRRP